MTLSPRYWAGEPSGTDGGRAPYAAVLSCDPSWSSKLAYCLAQQCKRICTKAVTGSRDRTWLHPMDRGKFWEPAQLLAYLLSDVLSLCSDDSLMHP